MLKIGGCEAIADLRMARDLGVAEIVAPMIESPFAVHKFKSAISSVYPSGLEPVSRVLVESQQGAKNLEQILSASLGFAKGINVGRSDMAASFSLDSLVRLDVSDSIVFSTVTRIIRAAKSLGFETTVGGKFTASSIESLLGSEEAIPDRFETRRLVFSTKHMLSDSSQMKKLQIVELEIAQALARTAINDSKQLHNAVEELRSRFNIPKESTELL
jgi:hypothetical protein